MTPEDKHHAKDDESQQDDTKLASMLATTVHYVTNEALVLANYELYYQDVFATLAGEDAPGDAFDERMNRIILHLGAPPEFFIVPTDNAPEIPAGDNYPESALRELISVFHRARRSVIRAHMFMTGASLLDHQPEVMHLAKGSEQAEVFIKAAKRAFWEHAEAAYIRLYSFWDRVGQVLDFAFFNIRKFDQNGFYAVMERLNANVRPMNARLERSRSWTQLRAFQTSEKDDGLKWLLLRRNLLVHSLHLHPVRSSESVFKSQFNHLETAHREKLRPRDIPGEVDLLVGQLRRAGDLFSSVTRLIELSPDRKIDHWLR